MPSSERQVIGVCLGLIRQGNASKVRGCKGMDFWDNLNDRKNRDALLTSLSGIGVAESDFFQDYRRDKGVTLRQDALLPFMGYLLVRCGDQISTW